MNRAEKIAAFSRVGKALSLMAVTEDFNVLAAEGFDAEKFADAFARSVSAKSWFTREQVFRALYSMGASIDAPELERWLPAYGNGQARDPKTVAVIMAGNIPAVGFHDFLSVLMSGHRLLAKLSSDDAHLLPAIAGLLQQSAEGFEELVRFTDGAVKDFDAVIATGSNNTSRYFDYYFDKYPHIIRRNRNALAVLTGDETEEELKGLGDDIFMYFGLGCRNVSKLYVPEGYDFDKFFTGIQVFAPVGAHHKYCNNYDYNKSIYLVNREEHLDNGFLLLKRSPAMASPVSVLYFDEYSSLDEVSSYIREESDNIQCVVSVLEDFHGSVAPGTAQYPKLWDYADGVDTMQFLLGL